MTSLNIEARFLALLESSGLSESIGGTDVVEQGMRQLKSALLQVASDSIAAEERHVPLSTAVFDTVNFPHLARFHGFIGDVIIMDLPADIRPWAERALSTGPPADAPEVRRWLVWVALHDKSILSRMLARLAIFEGLCLNQRLHLWDAVDQSLALRKEGGHLEALDGRYSDVEQVAESELRELLTRPEYAAAVVDLDDPWPSLVAAAMTSLSQHAQELHDQALRYNEELRGELAIRRRLLDALHQLPPADAVLLRNYHGDTLGEERVTIEQLQIRHPALLGNARRNTLDQRLKRLLDRGESALQPGKVASTSFKTLLLESTSKEK